MNLDKWITKEKALQIFLDYKVKVWEEYYHKQSKNGNNQYIKLLCDQNMKWDTVLNVFYISEREFVLKQ